MHWNFNKIYQCRIGDTRTNGTRNIMSISVQISVQARFENSTSMYRVKLCGVKFYKIYQCRIGDMRANGTRNIMSKSVEMRVKARHENRTNLGCVRLRGMNF